MILAFSALQRQRELERQRQLAILLRIRSSLRVRNVIRSISLPHDQEQSAWYLIYSNKDASTFVSVVSIPPCAFDDLLSHFARGYIVKSGPGKRGRPPRIVAKHAVLALLLHFYTHPTEHKTLCELFAVAPSTFSRVLANAEAALAKALVNIPDAAVKWPSIPLQQHWATLTNAREPLVEGVLPLLTARTSVFSSLPMLICRTQCIMVWS
jgi:hypothetical protein